MASDNTLHADILDNGLGTFDTAAGAGTLKVAIIKTGIIGNSSIKIFSASLKSSYLSS